jgi:hypothetical protein
MTLDHDDRRRLNEIEHHLTLEDPAFVTRMRIRDGGRPFPTVGVLCASYYVLAPIVMVLGGPRAGLVATIAFAASIAVILVHRRCTATTTDG